MRSPKHNSRDVKLISVFKTELDNVLKGNCDYKDYYVHDGGAAKKPKGFHTFLQNFLGIELPMVATYDGRIVPLYLQTLASCFYIEQKNGWKNVLATTPTYYKIRDVKRRVLEFVLNLSVMETERKYNMAKAKLKKSQDEWELMIDNIISRIKKQSDSLIGNLDTKPHIIESNEDYNLLFINEDKKETLEEKILWIDNSINNLNNIKEPIIENRSNALESELDELSKLNHEYSIKQNEISETVAMENDILLSISQRINNINDDLSKNKDLRKLMKLGSLEQTNIANSACPTCGSKIDDTLFDQTDELKIMSIDESIKYLENEKSMLEFSYSSQQDFVKNKELLLKQYSERTSSIRDRIRIVKSDLISNNKAISESHVQKIVKLELRKQELLELDSDIKMMWDKLISIGKLWAKDRSEFDKIPSNFITPEDTLILDKLNKEFKRLLASFNFNSTDVNNINIDIYNYLPTVKGFDLQSDSSASDTIRIIWAYIIALQRVSINKENNFGFLVFDEPAQQHTDLSSAKVLLEELHELSKTQQVFVFYKLEEHDGLLDCLDKKHYKRIHSDEHLIACKKPIVETIEEE